MNVLVVDGFAGDDPVVAAALATLERRGHAVRHRPLVALGFSPAMTAAERQAYHGGQPVVAPEVAAAVDDVVWADALLFAYPTTAHTVPAVVKGWLDRVMVPGVAFGFNRRGRVTGRLGHIRRLGIVTRRPAGRVATARARDGGRRTILWTLRLNCGWRCRRSYAAVNGEGDRVGSIERSLRRW